jgi:hypothetical protein
MGGSNLEYAIAILDSNLRKCKNRKKKYIGDNISKKEDILYDYVVEEYDGYIESLEKAIKILEEVK